MFKRIFSLFLSSIVLVGVMYFVFAPTAADAFTSFQSYTVVLLVTEEIDISAPGNATFSPSIPGMSGGTATASSSFVIKSTFSGFTMKVYSSATAPVLVGGSNNFADYVTNSFGTPDYNWHSPSSGAAEFGYSVTASGASGADAGPLFLHSGSACNTAGTNDSEHCWMPFVASPGTVVISRTTNTDVGGIEESLNYKAESNAAFLTSGTYTANLTATVAVQ